MGQAKQRGTYEQRLAAAQERDAIAQVEQRRIAGERSAERQRVMEAARKQRAEAEEARRQERIAAGLDPDPPRQSEYSAFGRRRSTKMSSIAAHALLVAAAVGSLSTHRKQGGAS